MGIAICSQEHLWDAMAYFDLASTFLGHQQITVDFFLLIKVLVMPCLFVIPMISMLFQGYRDFQCELP